MREPATPPARPLELVLFGATGFTGQLVARQLAAWGQARWGIAGRNYGALRRLRTELSSIDPAMASVEILVADADDPGALAAMAERSEVVLNAAGPFGRLGEPVVAACVDAGTDYADLTGEPGWWSSIVDRYHARAEVAGVRVVPASGFDAVPADLGAQMVVEALPGPAPLDIDAYLAFHGAISGGTWNTALAVLGGEARGGPGSPRRRLEAHRAAGGRGPHLAPVIDRWVVPMPSIDPMVVARSQAGGTRRIRYRHYARLRGGPPAVVGAGAAALALSVAARLSPLRRALGRLRPPGSGPSEAVRRRGWYRLVLVGRSADRQVVVEVRGGDPGYDEAAKMIAATGRLLAASRGEGRKGGVLTPALALGASLRAALEAEGTSFRVVSREGR